MWIVKIAKYYTIEKSSQLYLYSAKSQQKLYYDTFHIEQVKTMLKQHKIFLHGKPRGNH